MAFSFTDSDIDRIATVLGVEPKRDGALVRFSLRDEESGRRLDLEILTQLSLSDELSDRTTNLVTVYGNLNAFMQLHGCTGYIASEELGEIIFFAKQGGSTNGLIIERVAGCSLYANVDDRLLSVDFMQLPPEVMMSSVALSLTEDVLGGLK